MKKRLSSCVPQNNSNNMWKIAFIRAGTYLTWGGGVINTERHIAATACSRYCRYFYNNYYLVITRYATIRYDTLRYATIRYDTLRYDTIRYDTTIRIYPHFRAYRIVSFARRIAMAFWRIVLYCIAHFLFLKQSWGASLRIVSYRIVTRAYRIVSYPSLRYDTIRYDTIRYDKTSLVISTTTTT